MADMFADNLVRKGIINIIENKETIKDDTTIWKSLTRIMFKNYPAHQIWDWMQQSLEEASDKQWFENKYPPGSMKENWVYPKKKRTVIKINLKKSILKKLINDNLKITDVAKSYGLKLKGKGNMALCPFHVDTQRSLGFDDERNIFHCFGCNVKGDIIEFERRMKKNGISLEK